MIRSIGVLWLLVLSLVGCVQLEQPYEPDPSRLEVLPGEETLWQGSGKMAGWEIEFPAGAVAQAQEFTVSLTRASSSPVTADFYELITAAVELHPVDFFFEEPVLVRFPSNERSQGVQTRLLYAPDIAHLAAGFWDFAKLTTGISQFEGAIEQTGSIWPVRVLQPRPAIANLDEPEACIEPDESLNAVMEDPNELEGECALDTDCVVSGCQDEVCGTVVVETECTLAPRVCAACKCISQVCRWVQ